MNLGSIDRHDRKVLLACGALMATIIVAIAVFSPPGQDKDPTPYSDSTAEHGAQAAFLLLQKAGYRVERQSAPLSEVVSGFDHHTTLVIAEPFLQEVIENRSVIQQALERGARILVTGASGALLVPGSGLDSRGSRLRSGCQAEANGFGELANSGKVFLPAPVYWVRNQPLQSVEYTCEGNAVVVTYASGKGQVVWWASSYPLENAGITRDDNLALLLNSIGPLTNHVVWDESLHGAYRSVWSYAQGTPVHLVWWQLSLVAALLLFSYSRRSGPLRPDPVVSRAMPIEFVRSLGSLYEKAGATHIPVAIAYQRFRHRMEMQFGIAKSLPASDATLLQALTGRFRAAGPHIQKDLMACENAAGRENLAAREAMALVQALADDQARMGAGTTQR